MATTLLPAGRLRHQVTLQTPTNTATGTDGGSVQTWVGLSPSSCYCAIEPATAQMMERFVGNTIESKITHLVTMRYRRDVTTKVRLVFKGRVLHVRGIRNVNEENVVLELACEEVTQPS